MSSTLPGPPGAPRGSSIEQFELSNPAAVASANAALAVAAALLIRRGVGSRRAR